MVKKWLVLMLSGQSIFSRGDNVNLFKDKVAIVTGGGSGIGRALCEELGRLGAVVIVADINTEGANR